MVLVNNISQEGNLVSFDYYPEMKDKKGHCCFDFRSEKVISEDLVPEFDTPYRTSIRQAIAVVQRAISNQKDPDNMIFNEFYKGYWS